MPEVVLEMDRVYKKFKRGEIYDSLRDLLPALTGRLFRAASDAHLEKKEFWALADVSFQVNHGEAFGIIGYNGAGKSTILKLLSGIMKPTQGSLKVNGSLSALIEVGAGFHPDLTGRENIYLNGSILGMTKVEIRNKFDEIVDFSGLDEFIDTPVKRYSSGMYARLGFSVAAHVDPDVLIVDEVLSVGDFMFQQKCVKRMRSVIQGGATVIFVSHNLRAVLELCGRCMLLEKGRVIEIGQSSDVVRTYMERAAKASRPDSRDNVYISNVGIRDKQGAQVNFESGNKAWVDIEVRAVKKVEQLSVVLHLKDDSYYGVFDTSTERLGYDSFSLEPGETFQCTFELDLHLAYGTFHLEVMLYRYDIQRLYDSRESAVTFFVSSDRGVRGAVNCYPKVTAQRIVKADGSGASEMRST